MENKKRLTEKEFTQMIKLLHRYVNMEMDQWELQFFDTEFSRIYIDISMKTTCSEEAYTNMNNIVIKTDEQPEMKIVKLISVALHLRV